MKNNNKAITSIVTPSFAQRNLEATRLFFKIVSYSVVLWLCLFVIALFLFSQEVPQVSNELTLDTEIILNNK
ncbi:hypothetical protein I8751_13495 [Nostocaceae cyanobacterium CENA357]|uniref:Uncharacterized protein n=1 Tax=Atlanticothrix silvestris CENA357 TaxID=1725252 RepID=A0A8J7L0W4_9CYAN|nr:hypothetical protein [Atlanticothrix silvestris CENA357]